MASVDTRGESQSKLLQDLDAQLGDQIVRRISDLTSEALAKALPSALDRAVPPAVSQMVRDLGYSEEVAGLAQFLAAKSGDPVETVLKKALNLYGLALEAQERGNRLAILTPDDEIVREISGVGHVEEQDQPAR